MKKKKKGQGARMREIKLAGRSGHEVNTITSYNSAILLHFNAVGLLIPLLVMIIL